MIINKIKKKIEKLDNIKNKYNLIMLNINNNQDINYINPYHNRFKHAHAYNELYNYNYTTIQVRQVRAGEAWPRHAAKNKIYIIKYCIIFIFFKQAPSRSAPVNFPWPSIETYNMKNIKQQ